MFMWIWCITCAVFINNITAAYYSSEDTWATPYELIHNEPFMDSSIVVPFGCGVLVLLTEAERGKFQSRCALMIFVHYANQHPLYTYAVYSPRTKRILYRQDCIFLTNLFPMRNARAAEGLSVEGDVIVPYRSPVSVRHGCQEDLSFRDWEDHQPLPQYQDHVTGFKLKRPKVAHKTSEPWPIEHPYVLPSDPRFGPPSVVRVPFQTTPLDLSHEKEPDLSPAEELMFENMVNATDKYEGAIAVQPEAAFANTDLETTEDSNVSPRRRGGLRKDKKTSMSFPAPKKSERRPVGERWYYETVQPTLVAACPTTITATDTQIECSTILHDETGKDSKHSVKKNNSEASDVVCNDTFTQLGKVEPVSLLDIESSGNDEWTAWCLQGVLFYDAELDWCRILGWGVECGIIILNYAPISASEPLQCEHHASLADVLSLIKQSPFAPVVMAYQPSRILSRSETHRKVLCYKQMDYTVIYQAPVIGHGSSAIRVMMDICSQYL